MLTEDPWSSFVSEMAQAATTAGTSSITQGEERSRGKQWSKFCPGTIVFFRLSLSTGRE